MTDKSVRDVLRAFAEQALHAERYPNDYHIFKMLECGTCGAAPVVLEIEHHTGSKQNDFKGVIRGTCAQCGKTTDLFSFTGSHRKVSRSEKPRCTCGHDRFWTGMCERYEGDEGLLGFFDEGVIVASCAKCGKNRVLVFTD